MDPPRRVNKKEFRKQSQFPYSFEELENYYAACYDIYRRILTLRPDAIIAPLRGAEPILRTIQLIHSLEQEKYKSNPIRTSTGRTFQFPKVFFPRTGEQTDIPNVRVIDSMPLKFRPSMTLEQQKKELKNILGNIGKQVGTRKRIRLFLVDEAFSGGSISKHYELIQEVIRERQLNVEMYAASVTTAGIPKATEYRRLLRTKKIHEFRVPWLFITDSPNFLYPLLGSKKTMLSFLRRKLVRPTLGLSRRALEGRQQLFADVENYWRGTYSRGKGLNRLPLTKPRSTTMPRSKKPKPPRPH